MSPINKIEHEFIRNEKKRRRFFVFLFFVLLATLFWLLIRLSDDFTVQDSFEIVFVDLPADKWMPAPRSQKLKLSVTSTGFNILENSVLRNKNKKVLLSLRQVTYRKQNQNTYFISAQNLREELADKLDVDASDILFNEDEIYFTLEDLKSKTVPVVLQQQLSFRPEYELYGQVKITPLAVKVFGPEEVLDTLKQIYTEPLIRNDVFEGISDSISLRLSPWQLTSNIDTVHIDIEVERFTEASVTIPIIPPNRPALRLFPDQARVFYLVAMRDFQNIDAKSFVISVDTSGLHARSQFLNITVVKKPAQVHVSRISPEEVEYLILQP